MVNVLIAWSKLEDDDSNEMFKQMLLKIAVSVKTARYETDERHVTFVHTIDSMEEYIKSNACDVLVCDENLPGEHIGAIGAKTLKVYRNTNPDMNVILVIGNDKRSKGKMMGLYNEGFYNCLFMSDLKPKYLAQRLMGTRSREDAYLYYGLDTYKDLFTGSKGSKSEKTSSEPVKKKPHREKGSNVSTDNAGEASEGAVDIEYIGSDTPETPKRPDEEDMAEDNIAMEVIDAMSNNKSLDESEDEDQDFSVSHEDTSDDNVSYDTDVTSVSDVTSTPVDDEIVEETYDDRSLGDATGAESSVEELSGFEHDDGFDSGTSSAAASDDTTDSDSVADRIDEMSGEDAAKLLLKEDLDDVLKYIKEKSEEAMNVEVVERNTSSVDNVVESLLTYYTEKDNTFFRNLRDGIATREEFEEDLWQRIHSFDGLTDIQAQDAFAQFGRFMWGYDILEPFLVDKEVSDVKVVSPDHVQIKRKGRKRPVDAQFRSPSHYRAFVSRLAHRNHVDIHNNDIAIFTDTRSFEDVRLRVNITTEYINSSGFPCVQIRKINNIKYTTEQLIEAGMFGPRTAAYLINAAQNYSGIVFTGKGSAGKTTLMNWLIDYIPKDMSGLCIQESDELFSKTHPFIQFQRVTTNADGKKAYNLKDLSINGLLTDIDYFIIGESKGAESKYFTNAAYTGNRCWTSVHSPNSHGALPKIADYAKYESDYTKDDILQMLTSLQCVVFLRNFKVAQMSEVCGWDSERREIIYKDIPLDDPVSLKSR